MKVAVQQSTTKVFSLVGALAVLGALLFATSALAAPKEGPTGPTGATGPTGPAGEKGATGPEGAATQQVACKLGVLPTACTLASGYQETGVWSVHINAPTGAFQQQYVSAISFPVRLKKLAQVLKATYLTAVDVEKPGSVPGCVGTALEPVAEPGNLCVYRGFALKGGLEIMDHNAAFFNFASTNGETFLPGEKVSPLGELVLFRSVHNAPEFKEEAGETEPGVITEAAYMEGGGSWAVTEK